MYIRSVRAGIPQHAHVPTFNTMLYGQFAAAAADQRNWDAACNWGRRRAYAMPQAVGARSPNFSEDTTMVPVRHQTSSSASGTFYPVGPVGPYESPVQPAARRVTLSDLCCFCRRSRIFPVEAD